jgi:hypothetical protein
MSARRSQAENKGEDKGIKRIKKKSEFKG